jgi:hypothetical protein
MFSAIHATRKYSRKPKAENKYNRKLNAKRGTQITICVPRFLYVLLSFLSALNDSL